MPEDVRDEGMAVAAAAFERDFATGAQPAAGQPLAGIVARLAAGPGQVGSPWTPVEVIDLQKQVGNRATTQIITRALAPRELAPVRDPARTSMLQRDPIGGPARIKQLEESDEPYVAVDSLGWLGNLVMAAGWATAAVVPGGHGRGAVHLLHNMFAGGAPLEVEPEWVQAAPDWKLAYTLEMRLQLAHAALEDAIPAAQSGQTSGEGHVAGKAEAYSKPDVSCSSLNPRCPGADQFYGSGGARFQIEASYRWMAPSEGERDGGYTIDVELYDARIEYEDVYGWNHHDDPVEHRIQQRGWSTPFKLHAEWDEPGRALQVVMSDDVPPKLVELP